MTARSPRTTIWTTPRLLKLVVFSVFVVVAGMTFLFFQQRSIDRQIDELKRTQETISVFQLGDRERASTTRAVACRIEYALLLEPSEACYDSEVLEHWNPENSRSPHIEDDTRPEETP